jgi:ATP-dependent Clp protease, protease subunit
MQGIAFYNAMCAMPFELITHNIGNVDSIGNAVFLAGAKRYACSNSTFMFHGVGFQAQTQMHFQEAQLRERLDSVLADQKRIGDIIKSRTSLTDLEIGDLFLHEQTKDVAYASAKGIIHQVTPIQIPTGASVIQLIFKR